MRGEAIQKSAWKPVTDRMEGGRRVAFGLGNGSWFCGDLSSALSHSSCYKFAAKMIGSGKRVLDIGCGEGLGTRILAKECGFAMGIDREAAAVAIAQKNWHDEKIKFAQKDNTGTFPRGWDAVVCFDRAWIGLNEKSELFLAAIKKSMVYDGVAVLSRAPGKDKYKTDPFGLSEKDILRHFKYAFIFAENNGVITAGPSRSAKRSIAVCCYKK